MYYCKEHINKEYLYYLNNNFLYFMFININIYEINLILKIFKLPVQLDVQVP